MSILIGSGSFSQSYGSGGYVPFGYFGPRPASGGTATVVGGSDLPQNPALKSAAGALSTLASADTQVIGLGQAVGGIVLQANRLATAAQPFLDTSSYSLLNSRSVTSTSSAVSATVQNGATIQMLQVGVQQLATAQQNVGTGLAANAASTVAQGTNTFQLSVGTVQATLSVQVNAGATNNTVLGNLASAINQAGLGVSANVQSNGAGGVQLVVTGTQTGTANTFSLTDKTGNAVLTTGINQVSSAATNAQASVNGVSYTSATNQVALDNGRVNLKLNATTQAPTIVAVSVGVPADTVATRVQTLVAAANQYQLYYQAQAGLLNSVAALSPVLKGIDLQTLGITTNSDQTLSVNVSQLTQSLQSNFPKAQAALVGLQGLATQVNNQAQLVLSQPASNLGALSQQSGGALALGTAAQQLYASSLTGLFLNVRV